MNTDLSLQNPLEDASPQQKKSTISTETKQTTDCPICYSFPKPNITKNTELKLRLSERKCPVCGKNCGKPALLDLFSGAGGAARGYQKAGFCVLGVDIKPQPHYAGCRFIQADALTYPLEGFEAYHASPPCQKFTKKNTNWGRKRVNEIIHLDCLTPIRGRLIKLDKPFVIENVNGSPLNGTVMLCGTMFGLKIIKHRFFEINFDMPLFAPANCNHKGVYNPWAGKGRSAAKMREAMGIDWMPTSGGASRKAGYTGDLYNAIPPAYTEYIGKYLIQHLDSLASGNE